MTLPATLVTFRAEAKKLWDEDLYNGIIYGLSDLIDWNTVDCFNPRLILPQGFAGCLRESVATFEGGF